jgi:hypothetical protein
MKYPAWIGVDFDGTLEVHEAGAPVDQCGAPVPEMVARVKAWLEKGFDVRIVTARVGMSVPQAERERQIRKIHDWCMNHLGCELPVVCSKDYGMLELWDDRAVQVVRNTGLRADEVAADEVVGKILTWIDSKDFDPTDAETAGRIFRGIAAGEWKT